MGTAAPHGPTLTAKTVPRSVRLIEPYGVGGGSDVVAGMLGEPLSVRWERPVVVENHPRRRTTAAAPALVTKAPLSRRDGPRTVVTLDLACKRDVTVTCELRTVLTGYFATR
jgi:tripartite-type tricarboxylate transporter receptor subunit TctC